MYCVGDKWEAFDVVMNAAKEERNIFVALKLQNAAIKFVEEIVNSKDFFSSNELKELQ